MSNWSISKRISVLTGVLLAALAVVALIAMAAGWKSLSSFTSFKREAAAFAAVSNIEFEMFKARLAAVHYRRSGEAHFADDARSRLAAIAAREAEVVALFPQGSERRERMADIFLGARAYGAAFESLLESEAQQAEISGRLAATGAELTTIAQQAAIHPMVQATEEASGTAFRLTSEVDFALDHFESFAFARRSDDALESRSHLTETRALAAELSDRAPAVASLLDQATERFAEFETGLDELLVLNDARERAAGDLDRIGRDKQDDMDVVTEQIYEAHGQRATPALARRCGQSSPSA